MSLIVPGSTKGDGSMENETAQVNIVTSPGITSRDCGPRTVEYAVGCSAGRGKCSRAPMTQRASNSRERTHTSRGMAMWGRGEGMRGEGAVQC